MTELLNVLSRAFESANTARPVPPDPFGPDASWIPKRLMIAVTRVAMPEIARTGRHTTLGKNEVTRILAGFEDEWWTRTLALVASVGQVCRAALGVLRDVHHVEPRGRRLRDLREKVTGRVGAYYQRSGQPLDDAANAAVRNDVVDVALLTNHEAWDEPVFCARMTGPYAALSWAEHRPTPVQLGLGLRLRPPLCDSRLRHELVGTDRDAFSRYRLYYDLRARSAAQRTAASRTDPDGLEHRLATTPTEQVAATELDRVAHPYGLRQPAHHQVLPITLLALASRATRPQHLTSEPAPGPIRVDGSDETLEILSNAYTAEMSQQGWDVDLDPTDLESYVMRRLWNDLHRWERETELPAPRPWYVAQFKQAVTQYPRERAVVARGAATTAYPPGGGGGGPDVEGLSTRKAPVVVLPPDPSDDGDPAPEVLVHTVFVTLGALAPKTLLDWIRDAAERSLEDAVELVAPVCRAQRFGAHAERVVASLTLQALRGMVAA